MTPNARRFRNWAVVATVVEFATCLASLPLGFTRGGIARLSAGLNGLLAVIALVGAAGAVRASWAPLLFHALVVWGVLFAFVVIFVLSTVLTRTAEQAEDSFILLAVFFFFIADLVVGCFTARAAVALRAYQLACEREDAIAGGVGRGIDARVAGVARLVASRDDAARPADADAPPRAAAPSLPEEHDAKSDAGALARAEAAARAPGPEGGDDSPAGLCPVCLDRPKDAVFVDCGHSACEQCANAVRARYGHCFLCRKRIVSVLRVYV